MYAIVKNVASPPRASRLSVEPRSETCKVAVSHWGVVPSGSSVVGFAWLGHVRSTERMKRERH